MDSVGVAVRGFAGDENLPSGYLVNGYNNGRGFGGVRDVSGIEKIEVLKGPQAALYGRGEPGGVINIVTGRTMELAKTLIEHDDVDVVWAFGAAELSRMAEALSVGNMKRTFVDNGLATDWFDPEQAENAEFLRQAVQVKNIWIPYGE